MTPLEIQKFADKLWEAEKTGTPTTNLKKSGFEASLDDAYAIQDWNAEKRKRQGDRHTGFKVGLTSLKARTQLKLFEPDYGHLFEAMEIKNGEMSLKGLIQPKIEGEIA